MKVEVLRFIQVIIECVLRAGVPQLSLFHVNLEYSSNNRVCTPFFTPFLKNGVHTLLLLEKNGVPQLSLFNVKLEKRSIHFIII